MNHKNDDIAPFENPLHEREWQTQESAARRERLHLDPAGDDAKSRRYRLLARALRTPPADDLPEDFAQRMSAQVRQRTPALAFERVLTITLAVVFLLAAAVVTLVYGASWWPSFKVLLPPAAAAQWWMALGGCLALSWALGACTSLDKSEA
jgi:hypothetical protein